MAYVRVHIFEDETSKEVYDLTQTDEGIRSGDVLILEKEKIAGIMDKAWPLAITENHGEFHVPQVEVYPDYPREEYPEAVGMAEWLAFKHGWRVHINPPF